jgi:hypothetical protein
VNKLKITKLKTNEWTENIYFFKFYFLIFYGFHYIIKKSCGKTILCFYKNYIQCDFGIIWLENLLEIRKCGWHLNIENRIRWSYRIFPPNFHWRKSQIGKPHNSYIPNLSNAWSAANFTHPVICIKNWLNKKVFVCTNEKIYFYHNEKLFK